jgi:hypothetical protein
MAGQDYCGALEERDHGAYFHVKYGQTISSARDGKENDDDG